MTQHSSGRTRDYLLSAVDYINRSDELPFRNVLPTAEFFDEIGAAAPVFRERVYPPLTTLLAFVSQALSADGSCRQAVARVNAERISRGLRPASSETSSFCEARERLPEELPKRLAQKAGRQLESQLPEGWLWQGRHVKLVDGTTVSMPDTPENQREFPQNVAQKPGLGFPIARLTGVFSLASAALLAYGVGPYSGPGASEAALLREVLDVFKSGDVMLADAYYCSYFLIAALVTLGVDVVFRQAGARRTDFRRGRRLGDGDHVVVWKKGRKPNWMSDEAYDALADTLELREVKITVAIPGFRTRSYVIVTTLKSAKHYTKKLLADLYRRRWQVEVDLRTIKGSMRMDILRSRTPPMIRKEIGAHFLAYNLVRKTMADAALLSAVEPRGLSFKGTVQTLEEYRRIWAYNPRFDGQEVYCLLLYAISRMRVGQRPNRIEPRFTKRRLRRGHFLMRPRQELKEAMIRRC